MANCKLCVEFDDCPYRSDPDAQCSAFKRKPTTNADQIRNMGDTELANYLSGLCDGCVNCPMYYSEEDDECTKHCNSTWQEWVRKDAEEDE